MREPSTVVAVLTLLPLASPTTNPVLSMEAIEGLEDTQVTILLVALAGVYTGTNKEDCDTFKFNTAGRDIDIPLNL